MDWGKQVRIVGSFHSYHECWMLSVPPRTILAWEKITIFSEEKFAQEPSDPRHSSSWGCCHQLCALEGPSCTAAEQPPNLLGKEQKKQASAPASFHSASSGSGCSGQITAEPAGHLPLTSPTSQAQLPGLPSLWLHGLWYSFWWEQMQLAQTAPQPCSWLLPKLSWRSKRQTFYL